MKELDELTRERIHAGEIGALAKIAAVTGQRKVFDLVSSTVLFGDNVFDVMSQRAVCLRE
jgi:hypothetical protein